MVLFQFPCSPSSGLGSDRERAVKSSGSLGNNVKKMLFSYYFLHVTAFDKQPAPLTCYINLDKIRPVY